MDINEEWLTGKKYFIYDRGVNRCICGARNFAENSARYLISSGSSKIWQAIMPLTVPLRLNSLNSSSLFPDLIPLIKETTPARIMIPAIVKGGL
jgi:hypothetical protein